MKQSVQEALSDRQEVKVKMTASCSCKTEEEMPGEHTLKTQAEEQH